MLCSREHTPSDYPAFPAGALMMDVQLFPRLQAIDQQLLTLQRERHALLATFIGVDGLSALQAERRTLIRKLKEERARYIELEWQLDEDALRIKVLAEQDREGPTDLLIVRELVALRKRSAQREEQVLWQLERIADLEAQLALADTTITRLCQQKTVDQPEEVIVGGICCY